MMRINETALVGAGAVLNQRCSSTVLKQFDVDKANKYYGESRAYGCGYQRGYGDSSSATKAPGATANAAAENKVA